MMPSAISHRPLRHWIKLTVTAPAALADEIGSFLATIEETGVEYGYTAADQETAQETITAYFADDETAPGKEATVQGYLATLDKIKLYGDQIHLSREIIIEQDWNAAWKEFFKPFAITPTLIIKPSWEAYVPQSDEKVIEMDPGMAFGTGHHASTRLALRLLEAIFRTRKNNAPSFLDVGCGTGILAMAGALWGAKTVTAIDNDPDAVFIARQNIKSNCLEQRILVNDTPLDALRATFEVIVANITSDVLAHLAPKLLNLLKPGGDLVMAGILRGEQEESIRRLYRHHHGLELIAHPVFEEWAAFHFRK